MSEQKFEKRTIEAEVFGNNTQCLMSKAGTLYVKATLVTKNEDGTIADFYNACFFPDAESAAQLRDYLCQGREVTVTGNYSRREYVGKDGTDKVANDILVHDVKLGSVAQYEGGGDRKTTFAFADGVEEKIANAQAAQAKEKAAARQAGKPKTKVAMPDDDPLNDPLFGETARKEREASAAKPKSGSKGAKDVEEDWNDLSDINL